MKVLWHALTYWKYNEITVFDRLTFDAMQDFNMFQSLDNFDSLGLVSIVKSQFPRQIHVKKRLCEKLFSKEVDISTSTPAAQHKADGIHGKWSEKKTQAFGTWELKKRKNLAVSTVLSTVLTLYRFRV